MITGLSGGILWGLDTVILSIALSMSGFCSTTQAIALAPFVSTFFHDLFSSFWMIIYTSIKKQWKNIINALKTKSGKIIILGALLGGPVGMSGYVCAINYMGPAYTAVITAIYPAVGAFLARIFLKEKMKWYQFITLAISICAVIVLGYTPDASSTVKSFYIGFFCAILCVIGWASEAVICAYAMKSPDISNEHALQIRQLTSAIAYGAIIIPVLKGWGFTSELFVSKETGIILISALSGTASYLLYYKTIGKIGASKAMALNITYSAWAILFSVLLVHTSVSVKTVICCVVIVCASIITGSNVNELFSKRECTH